MKKDPKYSSRKSDPDDICLLEDLRAAHENLTCAIGELAHLTKGPVPAKETLDKVRWKLSRASLSRRMLWTRIHCDLAPGSSEEMKLKLRQLQEADMRLLRHSTEHVATWTTDRIVNDWPGYCLASQHMRSKMKEAIAAERRTLYPLLDEPLKPW